jgi:hypothetical protein
MIAIIVLILRIVIEKNKVKSFPSTYLVAIQIPYNFRVYSKTKFLHGRNTAVAQENQLVDLKSMQLS